MKKKTYMCPVCDYDGLHDDPQDQTFEICPQCGVEFGYSDSRPLDELKREWAAWLAESPHRIQ